MKYKVAKGNKIRNIKDKEGVVRIYQEGETLPDTYKVPKDYISNKIVEIIKKKGDK